VSELVAFAKSRPGQLTYALQVQAARPICPPNCCASIRESSSCTYRTKGGGPALIDVVAGNEHVLAACRRRCRWCAPASCAPLAVTSLERSGSTRDSDRAESGFPGFDAVTWDRMVARPVAQPFVAATQYRSGRHPRQTRGSGAHQRLWRGPETAAPEAFAAYIRSEITKWSKVGPRRGHSDAKQSKGKQRNWQRTGIRLAVLDGDWIAPKSRLRPLSVLNAAAKRNGSPSSRSAANRLEGHEKTKCTAAGLHAQVPRRRTRDGSWARPSPANIQGRSDARPSERIPAPSLQALRHVRRWKRAASSIRSSPP